jgi:Dolichyl-phosphate-mannose-protein mannosyltransferase
MLRVISSLFAGLVSYFRPITVLEYQIAIFPPSTPIPQWLDRVFISPWMRWDALWFERIVSQGYSATNGTTPFHPLYPWLATPLAKLGVSPAVSLMVISALAGIGLFYGFNRLAQIELPPKDAFFALMVFSLAPVAFILLAPYSEALFLLLSVLCLYYIRKKTWWLAGIVGGLAALTRQQGIFLVFPMAWEVWESSSRSFKTLKRQLKPLLATCFIPLGMLAWIIYRALIIKDYGLNLYNIQGLIYSIIISPSASKVVPVQNFIWPWQALYFAFEKLFTHPDVDIWVNFVIAALFLVILSISWKKMRISYRIFSFIITVVSFSYFTGTVHPYMGLPRHLYLAFPVFIGFASAVHKSWIRLLIVALSSAALLFLLMIYILNTWVP